MYIYIYIWQKLIILIDLSLNITISGGPISSALIVLYILNTI